MSRNENSDSPAPPSITNNSGVAHAYLQLRAFADKLQLKKASEFVKAVLMFIDSRNFGASITDATKFVEDFIAQLQAHLPSYFNNILKDLNKSAFIDKITKLNDGKLSTYKLCQLIWESELLQTTLLNDFKKIKDLHPYWKRLITEEDFFDINPSSLIDLLSNLSLYNVLDDKWLSLENPPYPLDEKASFSRTRLYKLTTQDEITLTKKQFSLKNKAIVSQTRDFAIIIRLHRLIILFWGRVIKMLKEQQKGNTTSTYLNYSDIQKDFNFLLTVVHSEELRTLIEQIQTMLLYDAQNIHNQISAEKPITITPFKAANSIPFTTLGRRRRNSIDLSKARFYDSIFPLLTPPPSQTSSPDPHMRTFSDLGVQ